MYGCMYAGGSFDYLAIFFRKYVCGKEKTRTNDIGIKIYTIAWVFNIVGT